VQMRTWDLELYKWNQTLTQICGFDISSDSTGLEVLVTQVADMNVRWTKLSAAVDRREVCSGLLPIKD
jgi:uncharacterized lipoprotein